MAVCLELSAKLDEPEYNPGQLSTCVFLIRIVFRLLLSGRLLGRCTVLLPVIYRSQSVALADSPHWTNCH